MNVMASFSQTRFGHPCAIRSVGVQTQTIPSTDDYSLLLPPLDGTEDDSCQRGKKGTGVFFSSSSLSLCLGNERSGKSLIHWRLATNTPHFSPFHQKILRSIQIKRLKIKKAQSKFKDGKKKIKISRLLRKRDGTVRGPQPVELTPTCSYYRGNGLSWPGSHLV